MLSPYTSARFARLGIWKGFAFRTIPLFFPINRCSFLEKQPAKTSVFCGLCIQEGGGWGFSEGKT